MVGRVVSPDLLGIHTSVYDGNMQLPTTPDLLKAAGVKSLRYPGGSYADLYHWETHTGTWTPAAGAGGNGHLHRARRRLRRLRRHAREGRRQRGDHRELRHEPAGHRPGVPQEAAAWVAYANGEPASTTASASTTRARLEDGRLLGEPARGGARCRPTTATTSCASATRRRSASSTGRSGTSSTATATTTATAAGRPTCASPTRTIMGLTCTGRKDNAVLAPSVYGMAVKQYAAAMKAVDPTIKIGAILIGRHRVPGLERQGAGRRVPQLRLRRPALVRGQRGHRPHGLPSAPETRSPGSSRRVRSALATPSYGCPADMPDRGDRVGTELAVGQRPPGVDAPTWRRAGSQYRRPVRRRVVRELHGAGRAGRPLARAAQPQLPRPDRLGRTIRSPGTTTRPRWGYQGMQHRALPGEAATRWCRRRSRARSGRR